jgi:class 3 adenylate cyclase
MDAPTVTGERRPVTALFADVVGSTALAETMDPEEWAELMAEATSRMRRVVERYEGRVGQVLGDGILAFFGAPVAHEDDPQRAVRTGLDLLAEIRDFGSSRRLPGADKLHIRVGINTGPVVVRDIGQRDMSALGDAVNVAARLQSEAEPDSVLVTADTFAFVRDAVEAQPAGALTLKGKAEPVEAFRILRWTGRELRRRGIQGLSSALVGRDTELARLVEALRVVRAGRGRCALVLGEPGIGKSRLTRELRREAEGGDRRVAWFEARCLSYGQGLPHHLVLGIVRAVLGLAEDGSDPEATVRERIRQRLGDDGTDAHRFLAHLLSLELDPVERAEIAHLAPEGLQRGYVDALRALLYSAASQPAVLVCDDVHWADPSSVELLVRLMPLVHELPLLVLLASRPDRDAPGWRMVTAARDELGEALVEVRLTPLGEEDSRALVGNLLAIESLPAATREYILSRAEGNPFFVEEVIRMLIDRGGIRREGDRWVATETVADVEIPDTIHGLLLARIDRLPADARETLRVASVIGRRFGATVLADVLARR